MLANPDDPAQPAFHVVAPSLPGYAWSTLPRRKDFSLDDTARIFNTLMTETLGYKEYVGQGGDWVGSYYFVTSQYDGISFNSSSRARISCDLLGRTTAKTRNSSYTTCSTYLRLALLHMLRGCSTYLYRRALSTNLRDQQRTGVYPISSSGLWTDGESSFPTEAGISPFNQRA